MSPGPPPGYCHLFLTSSRDPTWSGTEDVSDILLPQHRCGSMWSPHEWGDLVLSSKEAYSAVCWKELLWLLHGSATSPHCGSWPSCAARDPSVWDLESGMNLALSWELSWRQMSKCWRCLIILYTSSWKSLWLLALRKRGTEGEGGAT